jgi:chorismate dehydratase
MLRDHDAAVLIGDPALRATLIDGPARGWFVTDLAAVWREWQSLPFVFAVWAVRRDWAAANPQVLIAVRRAFATALAEAAARPDAVAAAGAARSGFAAEQLAVYYRLLDFGLAARQQQGLEAFARMLGGGSLTLLEPLRA